MNRNAENRYLNLIQLILSSPRKQEIDILNAHREFIDSDFISYLMSLGEELRKKGELQPKHVVAEERNEGSILLF